MPPRGAKPSGYPNSRSTPGSGDPHGNTCGNTVSQPYNLISLRRVPSEKSPAKRSFRFKRGRRRAAARRRALTAAWLDAADHVKNVRSIDRWAAVVALDDLAAVV